MSATLARFELTRQVRFVDTDASGFAHFSTYVRMMEETEYAFLRSRGLSVVFHDERGTIGFPRLSAEIQIHHPLVFEQSVLVQLELISLDGKRIIYDFEIRDPTDRVAIEGRFELACCRFPENKRPYAILIPEQVIADLIPAANPSNPVPNSTKNKTPT